MKGLKIWNALVADRTFIPERTTNPIPEKPKVQILKPDPIL